MLPLLNHLSTRLLQALLIALSIGAVALAETTEKAEFAIEEVTAGLEHPWSVAFLPEGRFLVTERPGRLRIVDADGHLYPQAISGLPEITPFGQGGLLDVALHPDFSDNRLVYISYAERDEQVTLSVEHQARAEMQPRAGFGQ